MSPMQLFGVIDFLMGVTDEKVETTKSQHHEELCKKIKFLEDSTS